MRSIAFIRCADPQSHFSLTLMLLSYYRNETKGVEGGGWFWVVYVSAEGG